MSGKLWIRRSRWLWGGLLLSFATSASYAAEPDAQWRAMVAQAFASADTVLSGAVVRVDNQTAVDGGHVYTIDVDNIQKGDDVEEVMVRAGGWMYTLTMKEQERVVLFLKNYANDEVGLVHASGLRPMAFKASGVPVDARLATDFAGVGAQSLTQLLNELGGQQQ